MSGTVTSQLIRVFVPPHRTPFAQLHRVSLSCPSALPDLLGTTPLLRKLALSELEWGVYDDRATARALLRLSHLTVSAGAAGRRGSSGQAGGELAGRAEVDLPFAPLPPAPLSHPRPRPLQELRLQCSDGDRSPFSTLVREYFVRAPDAEETRRDVATAARAAAAAAAAAGGDGRALTPEQLGVAAVAAAARPPSVAAAHRSSGGISPPVAGLSGLSLGGGSGGADVVMTGTGSHRVSAPQPAAAAARAATRAVSDGSVDGGLSPGLAAAASTGATPAFHGGGGGGLPLPFPPALEADLLQLDGGGGGGAGGGAGGGGGPLAAAAARGGGLASSGGGSGGLDMEVAGSPAGAGYAVERDRPPHRARAASVVEGAGWLGLGKGGGGDFDGADGASSTAGTSPPLPPSVLLPVLFPFRGLRKLTLMTRLDDGAIRALVGWLVHPLASRRLTKLKLSVPLVNASASVAVPLPPLAGAGGGGLSSGGGGGGGAVITRSRSASAGDVASVLAASSTYLLGGGGEQQQTLSAAPPGSQPPAARSVTLLGAVGLHLGLQKLTVVRPDGTGEVLRQPQCRDIGAAVAASASLWSLHLRRCGLWSDSLAALVPPSPCPRVTSVKLDGNSLGYLSGECGRGRGAGGGRRLVRRSACWMANASLDGTRLTQARLACAPSDPAHSLPPPRAQAPRSTRRWTHSWHASHASRRCTWATTRSPTR